MDPLIQQSQEKRRQLQAKRAEIDRQLAKIDELLALYKEIFETTPSVSNSPTDSTPAFIPNVHRDPLEYRQTESADQKATPTLRTPTPQIILACKALIRDRGPMKPSEMLPYLEAQGVHITGKLPANNLSAILSNSGRFVSTDAGWRLNESTVAQTAEGG